jgi:hypothetical protein
MNDGIILERNQLMELAAPVLLASLMSRSLWLYRENTSWATSSSFTNSTESSLRMIKYEGQKCLSFSTILCVE